MMMLLMGLLTSITEDREGEIAVEGMHLGWMLDDDHLRLTLRGRAGDWLSVAFNDRPSPSGARLFLARVLDGRAEVEEHLTDSQGHWPRDPDHPEGAARIVSFEEQGGQAEVVIDVPLGWDAGVTLGGGRIYHVTLAFTPGPELDPLADAQAKVTLTLPPI